MLAPEELPGPAESSDHLVGDQQSVVLAGDVADAGEELRRRNDVTRGALHRLDQDGGDHPCRGLLHRLPDEVEAEHATLGVRQLKGAAIAIRVGHLVRAPRQRPPLLPPFVPDQSQHSAGLAVEAAPKAHHLVLLRVRLGEADRRLDRFRPTAVELGPLDGPRSQLRQQLHEL